MAHKIPPPHPNEPKLDPARLVLELVSFRDELTRPITAKTLNLWIEDNEERKYIAANTVWGTIRLPKVFGLPIAPLLASAFVVEHRMWEIRKTNDQVNPQTFEAIVPTPPPEKWDGPHDEDYHRVSFLFDRSLGDKSEITVNFASNIKWVSESVLDRSIYREISPSARTLEHPKDSDPMVMLPFTVVKKRFFQ